MANITKVDIDRLKYGELNLGVSSGSCSTLLRRRHLPCSTRRLLGGSINWEAFYQNPF